MDEIRAAWATYSGRAIEPLIRDAIPRMLPDPRFGDARFCGGYWTRKGGVEVDLAALTSS
jgi:hypothetical protein